MNQYVKPVHPATVAFDPSVKITTPRDRTMAMIRDVAGKWGFTPDELLRHSKDATACAARAEVYEILSAKGWTANMIGQLFKRDLSTVQHSLERGRRRRVAAAPNLTVPQNS